MAITRKTGERILAKVLVPTLRTIGFSEAETLCFVRGRNPQLGITFSVRADTGGVYMFSVYLRIRFEELDIILHPEKPGTPTIIMPLHLLTLERNWMEWPFHDEKEAQALVSSLLKWIERLAEPFWQKYSVLSNVKTAIQSSDPADWFILGETQRIGLLAAIKFSEGDANGAIEMLDSILLERKGQLPKEWFPLKQVRDRIESTIKAA